MHIAFPVSSASKQMSQYTSQNGNVVWNVFNEKTQQSKLEDIHTYQHFIWEDADP